MTNEPLPEPPPGKPLEPPPDGALPRPPFTSRIGWKGKIGIVALVVLGAAFYAFFSGGEKIDDFAGDHLGILIIVLAIGGAILYSATHHRRQ